MAVGSMDDEALFGRVVYRLGYAEAVQRGVVAPLKLVFLDVSEAYRESSGRIALEMEPEPGSLHGVRTGHCLHADLLV